LPRDLVLRSLAPVRPPPEAAGSCVWPRSVRLRSVCGIMICCWVWGMVVRESFIIGSVCLPSYFFERWADVLDSCSSARASMNSPTFSSLYFLASRCLCSCSLILCSSSCMVYGLTMYPSAPLFTASMAFLLSSLPFFLVSDVSVIRCSIPFLSYALGFSVA